MSLCIRYFKKLLSVWIVWFEGEEGFNIIDSDNNNYLQIRDFWNITPKQEKKLQSLFQSIGVDITKLSQNTWFSKDSIQHLITQDFINSYNEITSSAQTKRKVLAQKEIKNHASWIIYYPPRDIQQAKSLQMMLQEQGYYTMKIDGNFWTGSKKALQRFLQAQWLYQSWIDGKIGRKTLEAIQVFNSQGTKNIKKISQEKQNDSEILLSSREIKEAAQWIKNNLSTPEIHDLCKKLWVSRWDVQSLAVAVSIYQSKNWLYVDGKAGNNTLKHIWVGKGTFYDKQIQESNTVMRSAEKFWWIDTLRWNWRLIFTEMYQKLHPKERKEIIKWKPFSLVDARTKKLLFVYDTQQIEMDVILWQNGITKWWYVPMDKRTPVGMVHRFDTVKLWEHAGKNLLRKWQPYYPDLMPADNAQWKNLYFDANTQSYRWDKLTKWWWQKNKRVTVVWVSIQSPESMNYGWRYFHLVWPGRNGTWGCVGIKYEYREQAKQMAKIISQKWGFWYVSKI